MTSITFEIDEAMDVRMKARNAVGYSEYSQVFTSTG